MTKSKLLSIIREECQNILSESYENFFGLDDKMMKMAKSADPSVGINIDPIRSSNESGFVFELVEEGSVKCAIYVISFPRGSQHKPPFNSAVTFIEKSRRTGIPNRSNRSGDGLYYVRNKESLADLNRVVRAATKEGYEAALNEAEKNRRARSRPGYGLGSYQDLQK